jgi:hypothetical protein
MSMRGAHDWATIQKSEHDENEKKSDCPLSAHVGRAPSNLSAQNYKPTHSSVS